MWCGILKERMNHSRRQIHHRDGESLDWFGFLLNVIYSLESKCWNQKNIFWSIISFSIFGFASLFGVLPRYGIYEFRCKIISEKIISNDTTTITTDCRGQIDEYQVWWKMANKKIKIHFCSLLLHWALDFIIYQRLFLEWLEIFSDHDLLKWSECKPTISRSIKYSLHFFLVFFI